jgi:hypothetical protein
LGRSFLSRLVPRRGAGRLLRHLLHGHRAIFLDYHGRFTPRYGYGAPPHPELYRLLDAGRAGYARFLSRCLELARPLAAIPARGDPAFREPSWINGYLCGLDAAALYASLALTNPERYVEVGSGNSTRFARRAIRDHGLRTKITSIDPHPRLDVDAIADEVIRRGLEDSDLSTVTSLRSGDILFIDGSHRCFMNSDATVFFLDVLPRLAAGVRVHVHDIFLPYDYPPEWEDRYYSEQYLLAAYLLGGGNRTRILLPNAFVSRDPELAAVLGPIWEQIGNGAIDREGCSFWLEMTSA